MPELSPVYQSPRRSRDFYRDQARVRRSTLALVAAAPVTDADPFAGVCDIYEAHHPCAGCHTSVRIVWGGLCAACVQRGAA